MRHIYDLEIADADLEKVKLGQKVSVEIKGKITELRLGEEYSSPVCGCCSPCDHEDGYKPPNRMTVSIESSKITAGKNVFTQLVEDEGDD